MIGTLLASSAAAMTETATDALASATLVGAGDIASCTSSKDSKTAALVRKVSGTVFTAGDNVYPDGSSANYENCYSPAWGVFRGRTRPVPGNHDYENNPGAAGYFGYFGSAAGPAGLGYYAYDAGGWRVYALNSEFAQTSKAYATELAWLTDDLAANPHECVLAIWHRPVFSTGQHGNSDRMQKFFQLLYTNGAEVVINGHDHLYERYVPMNGYGARRSNGVREFVVGTGGAALYAYKTSSAKIAVRNNTTFGVLKLTLSPGSYSWRFKPTTAGGFTDSGSATCH